MMMTILEIVSGCIWAQKNPLRAKLIQMEILSLNSLCVCLVSVYNTQKQVCTLSDAFLP